MLISKCSQSEDNLRKRNFQTSRNFQNNKEPFEGEKFIVAVVELRFENDQVGMGGRRIFSTNIVN